MVYNLIILRVAQKQLEKLPSRDYQKVVDHIASLQTNPRQVGYKKLQGRKGYRIRYGNYRVIYEIEDSIITITVVDVGDRKDVYR